MNSEGGLQLEETPQPKRPKRNRWNRPWRRAVSKAWRRSMGRVAKGESFGGITRDQI